MSQHPYIGRRVLTPSRRYALVMDVGPFTRVLVQYKDDNSKEWLMTQSVRFM
jgi:hypothetical protein